jgi:hypothetical protein
MHKRRSTGRTPAKQLPPPPKEATRNQCRSAATRQLRILAAMGFFFGDFIPPKIAMAARDCESGGAQPLLRPPSRMIFRAPDLSASK